ncbi:Rho guanine nucleotide exchange factor [Marasmius tenuissimus]|uniref:Rho guanine nucleotide exchange factor n=1 Tax=Marasmius tenuissimus TaxID=585030 RepID=A0ABR2ZKC9_9AGAR
MLLDPALSQLEERLKGIFDDRLKLQGFLDMGGYEAQDWLDSMQQLVDCPQTTPAVRSSIFTVMNVKRLGEFPIAAGGFGDVWKGIIGESTELVCLKVVKIYLESDLEKLSTEYIREAILWRQMKHPNILPFLGIYQLESTQQLCLISPWMNQGNLIQFLRTSRREDVDHHTLVHDVATGLAHLHAMKIVHSDLKGVNILITDAFRACIGDFGLSRISDTRGLSITTTSRPRGTGRWLAPELLTGSYASKESDIYSLGCVCFEIFTDGQHPFPELPHEAAVVLAVIQGQRPKRPASAPELTDDMWDLMTEMWSPDPLLRPNAHQVLNRLSKMNSRKSISAPSDWNESIFTQVWGNVEYRSVVEPGAQIDGDDSTPSAPSTSVVNLPTPDSLPPSYWDLEGIEVGPQKGQDSPTPTSSSSLQIHQDLQTLSIEVTTEETSTQPFDETPSSPPLHDPHSLSASPTPRDFPPVPRIYGENDHQLATQTSGASGSNSPVVPPSPKLTKAEEAGFSWPAEFPTFDRLVSENKSKHASLVRMIAEVNHAPEALAIQQARIKELQFLIEESMLHLVKISERLIRQWKAQESAEKPKAQFWSIKRRTQKEKEPVADATSFRIIEEEMREREKHNELKEELAQAEAEESSLNDQARRYTTMTDELDTLYNSIFNGFTGIKHLILSSSSRCKFRVPSDYPEQNQLQQQIAAAKAMYDRVEATFDAETQAYERLYRAEKVLHDCLEKLKEAVRCATSPTGSSFGRTSYERESACLLDAHTLASQVPSLVREARQLSPSIKPLRALAISQSIPSRAASEGREYFNDFLDEITSEVVRAHKQASILIVCFASCVAHEIDAQIVAECTTYSGRTAGAHSVLEGVAQTLSRYKDELRNTRKRIFDEVAARSSRDWNDERPPAYQLHDPPRQTSIPMPTTNTQEVDAPTPPAMPNLSVPYEFDLPSVTTLGHTYSYLVGSAFS